jgi:heme A synthase
MIPRRFRRTWESFLSQKRFAYFAWGVLAYNLAVIAWGAYVRATGAGAGCGNHWPLCNGEVVPRAARLETLVEFSHRVSSGLAGVFVLALVIWAWRAYPKGHPVRPAALLAGLFLVTEALIGRYLVLFELVAENASAGRAFAISVHLVNTFILLAFLALTAWWAGGRPGGLRPSSAGLFLGIGLLGMLVLGTSGAVTALGDTLVPAASLAEALRQDVSPTAHFLIRLRVLHPTIAVLVSAYLILVVNWFQARQAEPAARSLGRLLVVLVFLQLVAGLVNVILLAPVWLQLVHLFLADSIWITLVLLTATCLARTPQPIPLRPSPALKPSIES